LRQFGENLNFLEFLSGKETRFLKRSEMNSELFKRNKNPDFTIVKHLGLKYYVPPLLGASSYSKSDKTTEVVFPALDLKRQKVDMTEDHRLDFGEIGELSDIKNQLMEDCNLHKEEGCWSFKSIRNSYFA